MKRKIIVLYLSAALCLSFVGCGNSQTSISDDPFASASVSTDNEEETELSADPEENTEYNEATLGYSVLYGELLSAIESENSAGKVIVFKTKIAPKLSNKLTVSQNYFNVVDLIEKQGCTEYDQIQYWAVADMMDGSESKVVSFTLNSDLIQVIANANGRFAASELGKYVDDLYILPSLQS